MSEALKGAPVAAAINEKTRERVSKLKAIGVQPTLAGVRVGENTSDLSYERGARKRCDALGIVYRGIALPESANGEDVLNVISALADDDMVHGIMVYRPLPERIDDRRIRAAIPCAKDVDGITDMSMASVFTGGEGFCPCTAEAVIEMLDYYNVELTGARVTVLGRGAVIGKPVAQLLISRNATVTVCHTKTRNLSEELQRADIIVAAAGHRNIVSAGCVREGQVVIDVGVNDNGKGGICGDVDFETAAPIVKAITPVPGGVGGITVAVLMSHTVTAAEMARR